MPTAVISGIGLLSGLGDLDETWHALGLDRRAVVPYRLDGENFPEILGAPAADFDLKKFLPDPKLAKYMNPTTALTVAAAGMALENAAPVDRSLFKEMALFIATGLIAFDFSQVMRAIPHCMSNSGDLDLQKMGSEGLSLCNPLMPFKMLLNMPLGLVSIVYGIQGENFILYPGADQGGAALTTAVMGIETGRFERALVGGGVQNLSLMPIAALDRLQRVAKPSDSNRSGWALADAAAFLLLESSSSAAMGRAEAPVQIESIKLFADNHPDIETMAALLRQSTSGKAPDGLILTGSLNDEEDHLLAQACELAWPHASPARLTFDHHLGYATAAAVPGNIALAAKCITAASVPDWTGLNQPRRLTICAQAPEERLVVVTLKALEAVP